MVFGVFVETNRYISGIGMFDDMRVFLIPEKYLIENEQSADRQSVHVNNQGFVAAVQIFFEYFPDLFLGWYSMALFEDGESNYLFSLDCKRSTGAFIEDRKSTRLNSSHSSISYA